MDGGWNSPRRAVCQHPGADGGSGPEITLLTGLKDGRGVCWRPGAEAFEDFLGRPLSPTVAVRQALLVVAGGRC